MVSSVSYTDAEARVHEIVASNTPDFQLKLVKVGYHDVFVVEDGSETFFKVKVCFISFDEKSQKEKLIPFNMLINADNPLEAYKLIAERLGTVQDYQITDIKKTNILEVHFPVEAE